MQQYKRTSQHFIAQLEAAGDLENLMHLLHIFMRDGSKSTGTFTVNDNLVTFKSPTDTFTGILDNYGDLTVISPVNDPDARKLMGSDTVTLVFKKTA